MQLIKLRAIHQPEMLQWIERKACRYTSPENQNEIISIMALQVLREIASSIQKTTFFTLTADEVTDGIAATSEDMTAVCPNEARGEGDRCISMKDTWKVSGDRSNHEMSVCVTSIVTGERLLGG